MRRGNESGEPPWLLIPAVIVFALIVVATILTQMVLHGQ